MTGELDSKFDQVEDFEGCSLETHSYRPHNVQLEEPEGHSNEKWQITTRDSKLTAPLEVETNKYSPDQYILNEGTKTIKKYCF